MSVVICSKCKQDFYGCTCATFQPNEPIFADATFTDGEPMRLQFGSPVQHYLVLSREETEELWRFFLNCGYISYESYPEIHRIIDKKIAPFLKRIETQ